VKLRIATRKSQLALTQARWVGERLRALRPDLEIEEVHIVTQGDRILDQPLANIGGKGLFVSEVEAALTDGRADLAVHSMKDVPGALAEGLGMAAIPPREDPRDAFVTVKGSEVDDLPAGARVGTSSLRRTCLLRAHRPDLAYVTLRGNVDTRLRKLDEGAYDAIVLARAGLLRLGLGDRPHTILPVQVSIPAVGQGALGIEVRVDDRATWELVARLDDDKTRLEVEAERTLLARLEGSCKVPIAGHATLAEGGEFSMSAMVGAVDSDRILSAASDTYLDGRTATVRLQQAKKIGDEVAEALLAKGARELVRAAIAASERSQKQGNGGGRFGRWT
jgi:hydroxymethylbilane synthase